MPHTNRARRADHYRSIDGAANKNASKGGAAAKNHPGTGGARFYEEPGGGTPGRGAGRFQQQGGRGGLVRDSGHGKGAAVGDHSEDGSRGGQASKSGKKAPSVKNRIRSLTRLMNKPGIEEEQRLHLKRQVEELEGKVSEREKHERERALAIKYHKAKFFDRRKSLRRLAQIHRKLTGDIGDGERRKLEKKREAEEADLKYVLYFPKDKKYLPLGKGKEGPPRAQRSHDRLLQEALSRGEAAGWTEFKENLDKFVTIDRNRAGNPGVDAAAGGKGESGGGGQTAKRTKEFDARAVVPQAKVWEEDGQDQSGSRIVSGLKQENGQITGKTKTGPLLLNSGSDSGAASNQGEESDSDGDLSGDEGFGAAPSDEEDGFSFAEARMRWESGDGATSIVSNSNSVVASGGGQEPADGGDVQHRPTNSIARGVESDSNNGDGDPESDESVGDIYAVSRSPQVSGETQGGGMERSRGRSAVRSDDSEEQGSSDEDEGGDGGNSEDSDADGKGGLKKASPTRNKFGEHAARPPLSSGSDSGDSIDLNDDFFLEEKGSGTENADSDTFKKNGQRDGQISRSGSGRGSRGGRGGRTSSSNRGGGRGRGRHGRGGQAHADRGPHPSSRNGGGGRGERRGARGAFGGRSSSGRGGFGGTRGSAGRGGRGRGRGMRAGVDGVARPNKITRFDD